MSLIHGIINTMFSDWDKFVRNEQGEICFKGNKESWLGVLMNGMTLEDHVVCTQRPPVDVPNYSMCSKPKPTELKTDWSLGEDYVFQCKAEKQRKKKPTKIKVKPNHSIQRDSKLANIWVNQEEDYFVWDYFEEYHRDLWLESLYDSDDDDYY